MRHLGESTLLIQPDGAVPSGSWPLT